MAAILMSQLGKKYNVPTPIIDSMILLASTMLKRDLAAAIPSGRWITSTSAT